MKEYFKELFQNFIKDFTEFITDVFKGLKDYILGNYKIKKPKYKILIIYEIIKRLLMVIFFFIPAILIFIQTLINKSQKSSEHPKIPEVSTTIDTTNFKNKKAMLIYRILKTREFIISFLADKYSSYKEKSKRNEYGKVLDLCIPAILTHNLKLKTYPGNCLIDKSLHPLHYLLICIDELQTYGRPFYNKPIKEIIAPSNVGYNKYYQKIQPIIKKEFENNESYKYHTYDSIIEELRKRIIQKNLGFLTTEEYID